MVTARLLLATAAATVLAAAPAGADHSGDVDCGDFQSQGAAQAHLAAHPSDPDELDADNDGQACENERYGSGGGSVPVGGVDAGGGGAASEATSIVPLLGVVLGALLVTSGAGATVVVVRRRN